MASLDNRSRPSSSEAQAYCTRLTKASGSNFYYSFLFLPRPRRDAICTVYAFCREVDSAVDDPPPGSNPMQELARWRGEVAAAYAGTPSHPVTVSLSEHAARWDIPRDYFEQLIDGVEMDLTITRYATFSDLSLYCYRVASVVGLICLKIFGTRSPLAHGYAINLGLAFQLTNILRDLGTDADRGRIYLPQEDFSRFGCSEDDLLKRQYSSALRNLLQFQCERARTFYRHAQDVADRLPPADRQTLLAAEIMSGVYRRILARIEASGFQVFGPRISLPSTCRLAVAAGVWFESLLRSFKARTTTPQ